MPSTISRRVRPSTLKGHLVIPRNNRLPQGASVNNKISRVSPTPALASDEVPVSRIRSRKVTGKLLLILLLVGLLATLACSRAGLGINFEGWGGPTFIGNSVYVPTKKDADQASIRVIDAASGAVNGMFTATGESTSIYGAPVQGPGADGQTTFVTVIYTAEGTSYGRVFAIGPDGFESPVWQFPEVGMDSVGSIFGGVAYSQATNTVYFGADDGMLYALDAGTGEPKLGTGGVFFPAEAPIWSTPMVENGVVYFGTMDGILYGVGETGGKILEFKAGGAITATPIVEEGIAYVGSFDKNFYAVPVNGGLNATPRWIYATNGWIWADALFAADARGQDFIFVSSLDGSVQAVNAASGSPLWPNPFIASEGIRGTPALVSKSGGGGQFSSLADKVLVVGSRDGMLYGLDPQNGAPAWEQPFNTRALGDSDGQILAPVASRGNAAFVVTSKYDIFAVDANTGQALPGFTSLQ